jgi:hypothetical protein
MTAPQPWSIERVANALGNPALAQRFISEIHKVRFDGTQAVFAKWQAMAERLEATRAQIEQDHAVVVAGGTIPGEQIDVTEKIQAAAARHRARGAA